MLNVEPCSSAATDPSNSDSLMFAFSSRCFAVSDVIVAHSLTGRTDTNGHEGTVVSLMAERTLCCGDRWSSSTSRLTNHPDALWRSSRQICPRQPRRNVQKAVDLAEKVSRNDVHELVDEARQAIKETPPCFWERHLPTIVKLALRS